MTRSMTGFSSISGINNSTNFIIQLRSENSKNLDISIFDQLNNYKIQEKIRTIIKKNFSRGKIRISIDYYMKDSLTSKTVQKKLSRFSNLAHEFDIKPTISIGELSDIMNNETKIDQSSEKSIRFQLKLIEKGIKSLISSQELEGKNLIKEILFKLSKIDKNKQQIVKRTSRYKFKLKRRYTSGVLNNVPGADPIEIKKDINNALEKIDIEEEVVRLDSHILELKKIMKKKGPKGLKIDFFMQEINREANTISSKSKDSRLSNLAIEIKTYLNQIREIAANIE